MVFTSGGGLERLREHTSLHVLADRQSKQRQHRGRDVQQRCAVHQFVFVDVRAGHGEDPDRTMLDGGTGRDARHAPGAQVVGVETVVAAENDRRVVVDQLQVPSE